MYNPTTHISINERTKLLESIFPPEITNLIFNFVIKMEGFVLKNDIYFQALNFKMNRLKLEKNYTTRQKRNLEIKALNYNSMLTEMRKLGIDLDNTVYTPIYRQMAFVDMQPPWWLN